MDLHFLCTKNRAKAHAKMHFPSESPPFILQTTTIIEVGIISLTEGISDTKSYSRYICSPCLFTATKNHVYSGSSTGLILHRINLDSVAKKFFPCQLNQPCCVCPQTSSSWCQCSISLFMRNLAFLISSTSGCTFHTCISSVKREQLKRK